jgi:phosphohistidine swiveling domain-containing protein
VSQEAVGDAQLVARGIVASQGSVSGTLRQVTSVADVLVLMDEDLSETIIWTEHASVTSIVPILPQVRGVVCEGGGVTSHIAIVSRQFGLPCIVEAEFEAAAGHVDGRTVSIEADGRVLFAQDPA